MVVIVALQVLLGAHEAGADAEGFASHHCGVMDRRCSSSKMRAEWASWRAVSAYRESVLIHGKSSGSGIFSACCQSARRRHVRASSSKQDALLEKLTRV